MHILVVEDDPIVADVLGMTLEEAGYFKTTADSIESALFELKHNQIDAVLLDLNLPDGDGTRLARLIRKNHMPVPILVFQETVALMIRLPHLVLVPMDIEPNLLIAMNWSPILTPLSDARMVTVQPPSMSAI